VKSGLKQRNGAGKTGRISQSGKSGLFCFLKQGEGEMPDLTKWVRCDGKTYCWDKATHKVVEVKITDVALDQVPKDVLIAMLETETEERNR
jgi:hypothetical protein